MNAAYYACFKNAICGGNSELGSVLLTQSMAQSGSEELCYFLPDLNLTNGICNVF